MQSLPPFETELFFAKHEFRAPYLLSASDCETLSIGELLELAQVPPSALLEQRLGYTESWGDPELRGLIARRHGKLHADDVLVLSAPVEGLYLLSRLFQGECIVLLPAYDALKNLPQNVKPWNLLAKEGDWELDFEALDALVSPETELLVVNFPHNPTGFCPSLEQFQRLVQWARERDLWLFCDEIYRGLQRGGKTDLPSLVDLYEKGVVLGGLSKSHGLPGLRCGWLATRNSELLTQLHDYKLYTSICPAGPMEFLAKVALRAEEELLRVSCELVDSNLRLADEFFSRWGSRFVWRRPRAGSVGLVELVEGSAEALSQEWVERHGVVLLPSTFLGFPDRFLRFGFGRKNFSEALSALESVLKTSE